MPGLPASCASTTTAHATGYSSRPPPQPSPSSRDLRQLNPFCDLALVDLLAQAFGEEDQGYGFASFCADRHGLDAEDPDVIDVFKKHCAHPYIITAMLVLGRKKKTTLQ